MLRRHSGRWFWHPYTLGVMPDHPTGYTGNALYIDRRYWVTARRVMTSRGPALMTTTRSRYRLGALLNALLGRYGQVGTGS